jgi:hypothetical protein
MPKAVIVPSQTVCQALIVAGLFLGIGSHLRADSDLFVACGDQFAVFDKFAASGRVLGVIPFVDSGELRVASAIDMPEGQPHSWAIYREYVAVRTWNDVQMYRVGQQFKAAFLGRFQIDESRPTVGGTVAMELRGSVLRAYGVKNMLEFDLSQCSTRCIPRTTAVERPPDEPLRQSRCSVIRRGFVFAESEATTANVQGIIYHDIVLTRRKRNPDKGAPIQNPYRPESILYLGTRIETID